MVISENKSVIFLNQKFNLIFKKIKECLERGYGGVLTQNDKDDANRNYKKLYNNLQNM